MGLRVAVAGASGYAGGELLRLIAGHPELELAVAAAHQQAGTPVTATHPHLLTYGTHTFAPTDPDLLAEAELVFLALPHGQSAALAAGLRGAGLPAAGLRGAGLPGAGLRGAALPAAGPKIVDLGADHRLADAAAWAAYYGGPHAGAWTYGLPELPGQRAAIAAADRVAAPGCYATAITLALAPLLSAGLAAPEDVVVVAASGTSGAGRVAKPHLLGSEVMGDLSPYKVGAHQHVPEIKQATGAAGLSFTPVLAPMPRGILATVTAVPAGAASPAAVREALATAYREEPFVRLLPEGVWPRTGATLGANSCQLQATVDRDSGRIIVVSALDNLAKGAAGQAVQCANLMLGFDETAGLTANGVAP